jgi:hypothetical protein
LWDLTRRCTCILGFYVVSSGERTQVRLQKQLQFFPIHLTLNEHIYIYFQTHRKLQILSYQKKGPRLNTIEQFTSTKKTQMIINLMTNKKSFQTKPLMLSWSLECNYQPPLTHPTHHTALLPSDHASSQSITFQHSHSAVQLKTNT